MTKAIASGVIVPLNWWSMKAPIRAPSTPGTMPTIAAAVPATWASGRIDAEVRFGSSICTVNSAAPADHEQPERRRAAVAGATVNGDNTATRLATNTPARQPVEADAFDHMPLRYMPAPITSDMTPKNNANQSLSPNTSSRMISELAMYDRNTPNSAVRASR